MTKIQYEKLRLIALFLFGLGLTGLQAQVAATAASGDAFGSGGTVSYSVGQPFYTSSIGESSGSVGQGVQQAFEISTFTGIVHSESITLECSTFPNPTKDFLILKVDAWNTFKNLPIKYQIYDNNGKLIDSKNVESSETIIAMKHLIPATYFLIVTKDLKEMKTFMIIKN